MADLIPSSPGDPDDDRDDRDPKVIGLDSDEADDLLGAISSSTARTVLASLHESPATPSDLAAEIDTSLQNVQYHLGNLSEAGLIEVADTRYSEKGREMNVYTPADRALVVVAGREDETKGLKGALTRLIGGVGVLGIGAAVVNRLARAGSVLPFGLGGSTGGAGDSGAGQSGGSGADLNATRTVDSANATPATAETTSTPTRTATETATTTDGGGGFSIAEATTTADSTTQTAEATRTAVESTPTVTEAAQTATETVTATPTPTQTPVPDTTAAQTATETAARVTSGSGGLAETIGTLSPGTLFFLGGLTVLLAWVAVGVLRD